MKKVVTFLLAFLIFVTPVTTLVKADVVIGDNDNIIVNENATILGRKLAMMESLSDLALSGVTEFTISNTNDVDSYLDYLWNEIDDALESLSDGTGFSEISNDLKSKYFTNLVQYQDYINNRGDYLAHFLQNPSTSLLSTYFANNIYGKQTTQHYDLALDMFRSLSRYNNSTPVYPDPDFSFISNVNNLYYTDDLGTVFDVKDLGIEYHRTNASGIFYMIDNTGTYCGDDFRQNHINVPNSKSINFSYYNFIRIDVDTNDPNNVIVSYTPQYPTRKQLFDYLVPNSPTYYNLWVYNNIQNVVNNFAGDMQPFQTSFAGISTCINYIYQHFSNIDLYVDDVAWVLADNVANQPTLDIDGIIKIFGNDRPQQYQLQPYTKIDYDQLYQVIYNAIRDNLPISQGDINYYDSHDTIYSPTFINNYGEEEGDESDLIDTILDYAVIPKFDTAIAQPMRQALTNGVVIMNTSITDVIPNEILLILGACFFLLLFAVVINRMIK